MAPGRVLVYFSTHAGSGIGDLGQSVLTALFPALVEVLEILWYFRGASGLLWCASGHFHLCTGDGSRVGPTLQHMLQSRITS